MKKLGQNCIILLVYLLLCACAMKGPQSTTGKSQSSAPRKNLAKSAVLTDPIIKKDFRNLKAAALKARVYEKDGNFYLVDSDIKQLNALSAILIDRLENHYHFTSDNHEVHTFIGKNQRGSCYVYYDSDNYAIGKECGRSSHPFKTCKTCDELVTYAQKRIQRVVHLEKATVLLDSFKLRNNDYVYLGLSIS